VGSVNGLSFQLQEIPQGEFARIAYIDGISGKLNHIQYLGLTGINGNCGSTLPQRWRCETVATVGITAKGVSLAIDPAGNSVIAYEDASDERGLSFLKIAQTWSHGLGNCTLPGNINRWQCETLAWDSSGYISQGAFVKLLVNSAGLGSIAYYAGDSYAPGAGSLRYATQFIRVFLPLTVR
ncbi:MAG: hypothetical protein PHQ40_09145, partial [Anaerolineaceae bacterium]|nr:hypothetical protein [Anaerolineaceae bacterium]